MSAEADEFCRRVWKVIAEIPYGCVMSYGRVAEAAGFKRAARKVGPAMRKAPKSLNLPWHRVIQASGKIAFPEGSEKYALQRSRLEKEGLEFDQGKIKMSQHTHQPSLDEMLWKP